MCSMEWNMKGKRRFMLYGKKIKVTWDHVLQEAEPVVRIGMSS